MKLSASLLLAALGLGSTATAQRNLKRPSYFRRVSTFLACEQLSETCDDDTETAAENVRVTDDGNTAIYTDSERGVLSFVDIRQAESPRPIGTFYLPGNVSLDAKHVNNKEAKKANQDRPRESIPSDINRTFRPTSVALKGRYALVTANTSEYFINPSGVLLVIDVGRGRCLGPCGGTPQFDPVTVREIELGGQPNHVEVSPNGNYAVITIENERDEGLGDGKIPQLPAGFVLILDIEASNPEEWTVSEVPVTGIDGVYEPGDPEPEFAAINEDNIAAVTLQENNAIVLIDLQNKSVLDSFTAGTVNLMNIDTKDDGKILPVEDKPNVRREPDGVTWIGTEYFATANEGDMLGARGFTIFHKDGTVAWESYSSAELIITRLGHLADDRSDNKGSEPENVVYIANLEMLFVHFERAHIILVYDVSDPKNPVFHQALPSNFRPQGGAYALSRKLYVAACGEDNRGNKLRGGFVLYKFDARVPEYPTLISDDAFIGVGGVSVPIAWSALSGLSPDIDSETTLYAVDDSAFKMSKIFTIDTSGFPSTITKATFIKDTNDVFKDSLTEFGVGDSDVMINEDKTVNIDSEGIVAIDGGYWIAHEGRGTVGDLGRPVESLNMLFKTDGDGGIEEVVALPEEVNAIQLRFGFEGVTAQGDYLIVAFQRAWPGDDKPNPRLGIYNTGNGVWKFVYYLLDEPASQNGGWVGLSDITHVDEDVFWVLERDNQAGPDAAIKRIYSISLDPESVEEGITIEKTLVKDVLSIFAEQYGGVGLEKLEGLAYVNGGAWVANDNDAVDGNTGETQLRYLSNLM